MTTLIEYIARHAKERPANRAVSSTQTGEVLTWSDYDRKTTEFARAVKASGIEAGDRVGMLEFNTVDFAVAFAGIIKAGAIAVPLNWRLAAPELREILASFEPKLLLTSGSLRPLLDQANSEWGAPVIEFGTDEYDHWQGRGADVDLPASSTENSLPVCIMYTSGSTGRPKGVVFPNSSFSVVLPGVVRDEEIDAESVLLQALPLFHIGGLAWMISAFIAGGESVVMPAAAPDAIMQSVETFGVTHLCVVSTLLGLLLEEHRKNPSDMSTLKMVQCGGSTIPDAHLRAAAKVFDAPLVTLYGLSEAGGLVANQILTPEMINAGLDEHRLMTAGTAVEGMEITIRDIVTGEVLPANTDGEIVTRTEAGMSGYWNEPDKTAETLSEDGWLRTGDIGSLDESGYLYIKSRLKELIISGGENIYPAEIESVLVQNPKVASAAVVGAPHGKWGESPVAFVTLHEGETMTETEVIDWCRERLAAYKRPQAVFVVEELPKLGAGKINRPALRRSAEDTFAAVAQG
jgi:acyl-CoA synthetase (AMP-forming)/AMP-acid ligase II